MAREDGEYIQRDDSDSDEDLILEDDGGEYNQPESSKGKGRTGKKSAGGARTGKLGPGAKGKGKGKDNGYSWEASYKRSWDAVKEDEGGSLAGAVKKMLEGNRRRRNLKDAAPVQRGIIRHMVLILDLSESMNERDMRPNRHEITLQYAREFVAEYFDQNPIGQLAIIGTRSSVAERIVGMGGNTVDHLSALSNKRRLEPRGEPSLQNALDMARSTLSHLPASNSREVLVLFGSLTTCDPGNIHDTIRALVEERVRVSLVSLAAEVKVCKDVCTKTGGTFGVAMNEGHYRDLIFACVPPPEVQARPRPKGGAAGKARQLDIDDGVDLMQMGFPLRLPSHGAPSLCACHGRLKSAGHICPRCSAKVCDVPTDCPVCGLTIVMSTHLARSYHHLFPVTNYKAVRWTDIDKSTTACFACSTPFPDQVPTPTPRRRSAAAAFLTRPLDEDDEGGGDDGSVAPSGRYACPRCEEHFCLECDGFVHEVLHTCPGCC